MQDFYKLKKKKMFDYPNCDYEAAKNIHFRSFNQFLNSGCSVLQCVNGHYYHGISHYMNENGMDKFVAMLVGMLFMIEHKDVEVDQAWGTNCDIKDFESGEYDDLFTKEDLKLIKADIEIVKNYLSKHPELLKD